MTKSKLTVFFLISIMLLSSCASFVKTEDELKIKGFEKAEYILLADAGEGDRFIKKGERVKIYTITGDDYIKVLCYNSKKDFVKAQRTLIIYLFKEDFDKAKFNIDFFREKLYSKVSPVTK